MAATDEVLDPFALPLDGVRLVEASAGTGKTFTLALLYLRCLLERGLSVDRILVVTFTRAATEELRGRIRGRLAAAARALEEGASDDPVLDRLLAGIADRGTARRRIDDALIRLDEAGVFTIHGFCGQMLEDNAFESGALFDTELVGEETELRLRAVEDFWRREFYGGPRLVAAWACARWGTPARLLAVLDPLLRRPDIRLLPTVTAHQVAEAAADVERSFAAAARLWRAERAVIGELLHAHPDLSRSQKNYRADVLDQALEHLDAWLAGAPGAHLPKELRRFTAEAVAAGTLRGAAPPELPFFARFSELAGHIAELDRLLGIRLVHQARAFLARETGRLKAREGVFSYDDLLARLAAALDGPGGGILGERIRRRFPVAMVDEFQDTDPLQYGIFRAIYGDAREGGLFFIGDPKQAIYGFRGADVFTYMAARRAAAHRYTLDTNYRSAAGLVGAVNGLFGRAAAPFVYHRDIPFQAVQASGRADGEPLTVDGAPVVPLQVRFARRDDANRNPGGMLHGDWAGAAVPAACAGEVAHLLRLGGAGRARLGERPLAAGDVAVLVRDHRDARAVQQALQAVGVGGVVVSRESVFAAPEAWQLARVLEAVAAPRDHGRLRAALSLEMLGGNAARLHRLAVDETATEPVAAAFRDAQRRWLEQGFLAMFLRLLQDLGVARRLLAVPGGERALTNLLQLGELLQQASGEHHTAESLLRWFATQRAQPEHGAEDQQLRLESDENLVQIVTIHRSKGLEYPVVLLPYLWKSRTVPAAPPLAFHDGTTQCVDLGSDRLEAHHGLAERERLAEDLRLLYVALTRASHLCMATWGAFNGAAQSALAYILHGPGAMAGMTDDDLLADLEALAAAAPGCVEVADLGDVPASPMVPQAAAAPPAARPFNGTVDRRWRIHSYSALVGQQPGVLHERLGEPEAEDEGERAGGRSVHDFPRGARAGIFFHELLEHLDFPAARGRVLEEQAERQLARHGFDAGWRGVVAAAISAVLDTPLTAAGDLRLRDIGRGARRDELAFHYPLAGTDSRRLAAMLGEDRVLPGAGSGLHGMMKGYVDLVFEHRGRYFLADYKSNHLGPDPGAYAPERLAAVMRSHGYELQYHIYVLALHRYLRRRLADYDYERHFGGVYYLFLRGMTPQTGAAAGVWFHRPAAALVAELDDVVAGVRE